MLQLLRGLYHFNANSYVKHTKIHFNASTTFYKHYNPFLYQILARMLSFFGKLKPAIKDTIISDCTFDSKMQAFNFPKARRPMSECPDSKHPDAQSPSI